MRRVALLPPRDRSDLFRAAAGQMGTTVQIVEKDFWVCWMLSHLFSLPASAAPLYFKASSSLLL